MTTEAAKVTSIDIVFDTYDFWAGEGWHEDGYIDRIDTTSSEAAYHGQVAQEIARLWGCPVSWETKSSGTGNDVYVTMDGDDYELEEGVKSDVESECADRYVDYEKWVVE